MSNPVSPVFARKGECEGKTFAGFPLMIEITARRRRLLPGAKDGKRAKKKDRQKPVFLFGARGGTASP